MHSLVFSFLKKYGAPNYTHVVYSCILFSFPTYGPIFSNTKFVCNIKLDVESFFVQELGAMRFFFQSGGFLHWVTCLMETPLISMDCYIVLSIVLSPDI